MNLSFETLKTEYHDGIFRAVINRPQALNALNEQVLRELGQMLQQLPDDTKALVLTGAGEKAFVAGADISAMATMNAEQARSFARLGQALTLQIEALPIPVIALVDGFALGGGCELVLACDIVLATEKSKFGQPEVHLGLIPGFGGTQRLLRKVNYSKAMEMLLTGRHIDAHTAYDCGLLSHVASDRDTMEEELAIILKGLRKAGHQAVAMTKHLAHLSRDVALKAGLEAEAEHFGNCFSNGEGQEGMQAFLDKRSAQFSR